MLRRLARLGIPQNWRTNPRSFGIRVHRRRPRPGVSRPQCTLRPRLRHRALSPWCRTAWLDRLRLRSGGGSSPNAAQMGSSCRMRRIPRHTATSHYRGSSAPTGPAPKTVLGPTIWTAGMQAETVRASGAVPPGAAGEGWQMGQTRCSSRSWRVRLPSTASSCLSADGKRSMRGRRYVRQLQRSCLLLIAMTGAVFVVDPAFLAGCTASARGQDLDCGSDTTEAQSRQ